MISNNSTPDSHVRLESDIIYTPVEENEFRILVLEPGSHGTRIRCTSSRKSIDDRHNYIALSYTWSSIPHVMDYPDDEDDEIEIEINRISVWIQRNLAVALSYLRLPQGQRSLWVDAICINQSNSVEKTQQLLLMKKIYQKAESVISWLGGGFNESSKIMRLISNVAHENNPEQKRKLVLHELMDPNYDFREALDSIFRRSYWYRAWIIQEIYFAKKVDVVCGPRSVSWDSLIDFLSFLDDECYGYRTRHGTVIRGMGRHHIWERRGRITAAEMRKHISNADRVMALGRFRNARYKSTRCKQRRTLDKLLFDNWDVETSDPRDKVFAILQLASDRKVYNIIPDYTLSVRYVYTNTVEKVIRITRNLSITVAKRWQDPQLSLPSWCPDFSSTIPKSKLGWHDAYPFEVKNRSRGYCAAGKNSKANIRFSVPGWVMNASGWEFDSIQSISKTEKDPRQRKAPTSLRRRLWKRILDILDLEELEVPIDFEIWYAMHRRALDSFVSAEYRSRRRQRNECSLFEEICRKKHQEFFSVIYRATTSLADTTWDDEATTTAKKWCRYEDIPEFYGGPMRKVLTPSLRGALSNMGPRIMINENYACYFITSLGFMGLGPLDMTENDRICILRGSDFPIVLRFQDRGLASIVGACYVEGFMYGEFFKHPQFRTRREKEFAIC